MVKHFFQTQRFRDFDFHIPFAGHHGIPIRHLAGHKFMSFEEDEVPGDFFLGDGLGWEFLSCFVSKFPQLTLEPKEQAVFLRGAVFFFG